MVTNSIFYSNNSSSFTSSQPPSLYSLLLQGRLPNRPYLGIKHSI